MTIKANNAWNKEPVYFKPAQPGLLLWDTAVRPCSVSVTSFCLLERSWPSTRGAWLGTQVSLSMDSVPVQREALQLWLLTPLRLAGGEVPWRGVQSTLLAPSCPFQGRPFAVRLQSRARQCKHQHGAQWHHLCPARGTEPPCLLRNLLVHRRVQRFKEPLEDKSLPARHIHTFLVWVCPLACGKQQPLAGLRSLL